MFPYIFGAPLEYPKFKWRLGRTQRFLFCSAQFHSLPANGKGGGRWATDSDSNPKMENTEEAKGEREEGRKEKRRKGIIQIPSYEEVLGVSGGGCSNSISDPKPYNPPPPSQSFSQAFSFLKSSEFYTPPPPQNTTASSRWE